MPNPSTDPSFSLAESTEKTEERVEELIADIGRTIRAAEPEKRPGLKELAETLLHEEVSTIAEATQPVESPVARAGSNPLFAGILLVLVGLGFLLVLPPVGLTLAAIGAVLAVWGGVMSWFKK
jgi:hypothetical protein